MFNLSRINRVNKSTSNKEITNIICDIFGEPQPFPERVPPTRLSNVGTIKLKRMIR